MRSEWPKALLFDMDGLSVDTEPLWFISEQQVAIETGISWDEADHLACVGGPVEKMARRLAERAGDESLWQPIADRVIAGVASEVARGLVVQPGVSELVIAANDAGIPIGLVSGSPRVIVDAVLSALPWRYAVVISCDDVTATKPAAEPYLAAAGLLGVSVDDCLALEDSPTGAQSALGAGMRVVVVPSVPVADAERLVQLPTLEGITLTDLVTRFHPVR